MPHKFDADKIRGFLEKSPFVSKVELVLIDEMENRGFYKLRAFLVPSPFKLDLKFIKTENDFIYSYQLYSHESVARWDNEPHYPALPAYPHHAHAHGKVEPSPLSGHPEKDLVKLLELLPAFLTER